MTLLIDIGDVPAEHCDGCLDDLYKALAEDPHGAPESIWAPHENPLLREHVEDMTRRFGAILRAIQTALARALTGEPMRDLQKAALPWMRWDDDSFERARDKLESKPTSAYTLDDWLLLVDYLIQRYLGDDVIQSEAEYLLVRAGIAGKIMAAMERPGARANSAAANAAVMFVPTRFRAVPAKVLTPVEREILLLARTQAATNIRGITDAARVKMRTIITEHVQAQVLGQTEGTTEYLRSRLFDSFGVLNRDFRRIAVTEAGDACNTGYIAAQAAGAKVKRKEAYRGACPWCRSINGMVVTVVPASKPDRDGETEVWVGKSNVGRSASPRQREGNRLVERPNDKRWWIAAGVQHPHCRGSWLPVPGEAPPAVSPAFVSWLDGLIAKAKTGGAS